MSEVYWLGGASPQDWEAQSSRLGIRPAWIDEAHWCGMPAQSAWIATPPSFEWPDHAALQARLLQDCARLLLTGERSLVLLASSGGVALLASPRAIGRLNLIPAARLPTWATLSAGSGWPELAHSAGLPISTPTSPLAGSWRILFPPPAHAAQELPRAAQNALELPPALLERCAALRGEIANPNDLLWRLLEDRQVNQAEFSRGQELDGQVLDFFCPESGLVVLIDHRADLEDAHRMHVFAQHGLRVLRFWNSQVIEDTPEVLQSIWAAVSAAGGAPVAPPESPPAQAAKAACQILPSPGGIAGLNALCQSLKPGWRGLWVESPPAQPLSYLVAEGI